MAAKCGVITAFRDTIGLAGRLSTGSAEPFDRRLAWHCLEPARRPAFRRRRRGHRCESGHREPSGTTFVSSPCSTRRASVSTLPSQTCCLGHVTTAIQAIHLGAPVDLVFQSIAGSEKANRGFGIGFSSLTEARTRRFPSGAAPSARTSCISEPDKAARYPPTPISASISKRWRPAPMRWQDGSEPLLVNSVCGVHRSRVPPQRQGDQRARGWKTISAASCSACRWDATCATPTTRRPIRTTWTGPLTLLCAAGVTFVIAVPGADDVMLNYQSLSFHDILYARETLGRRCAPEFEDWLLRQGFVGPGGRPID